MCSLLPHIGTIWEVLHSVIYVHNDSENVLKWYEFECSEEWWVFCKRMVNKICCFGQVTFSVHFNMESRSETAYIYERLKLMLIRIENPREWQGFNCLCFLVVYIVKFIWWSYKSSKWESLFSEACCWSVITSLGIVHVVECWCVQVNINVWCLIVV